MHMDEDTREVVASIVIAFRGPGDYEAANRVLQAYVDRRVQSAVDDVTDSLSRQIQGQIT